MWNTVDIVEHCRPKVVLWENVKNLLSKRHRHNFDGYLEVMEQMGYNNYYQVLNAKNYGIPQNRERVFTVSIRKDVDKGYTFPKQQELTLRLKDILEDQVNEKYYINKTWKYSTKDKHDVNEIAQIEGINYKVVRSITDVNKVCRCLDTMGGGQREPKILEPVKVVPTLTLTMYKDSIKVLIPIDGKNSKMDNVTMVNDNYGMINGGTMGKSLDITRRCYSVDYISPTITTFGGGSNAPKIIEPVKTENKINVLGNYMPSNHNASRVVDVNGICPTAMENHGTVTGVVVSKDNEYRIRKLTPKECWRLMGFTDEQFDKAAEVCSNTQLYKQAGNSIVVNVLEEIFKNLSILKR